MKCSYTYSLRVRWILLVICKIPLALKKFYRCKDPSHTHDVCIRYKGKENKRDLIYLRAFYISFISYILWGHFISLFFTYSHGYKMPSKYTKELSWNILLWQIVFWYIKGKMIYHHPQDQKKQNSCITDKRMLGWGLNRRRSSRSSSSSVHAIWTHFTSCERKIIKEHKIR